MLTKLFKGIDTLLKDNKITQETIDAYIKHNATFDDLSDKDEDFEKLKDVNIVEAYNHVIKQEWFKKWAVDNKVEDGNEWLKDALSIMMAELQVETIPELQEVTGQIDAQIAALAKEGGDDANEAIKAMEDQKKGFEAIIKAAGIIPQLSDTEVKLIEKNAEAIEEAGDNGDNDPVEEGEDEDDMD